MATHFSDLTKSIHKMTLWKVKILASKILYQNQHQKSQPHFSVGENTNLWFPNSKFSTGKIQKNGHLADNELILRESVLRPEGIVQGGFSISKKYGNIEKISYQNTKKLQNQDQKSKFSWESSDSSFYSLVQDDPYLKHMRQIYKVQGQEVKDEKVRKRREREK